jgi:hypothetical protein
LQSVWPQGFCTAAEERGTAKRALNASAKVGEAFAVFYYLHFCQNEFEFINENNAATALATFRARAQTRRGRPAAVILEQRQKILVLCRRNGSATDPNE